MTRGGLKGENNQIYYKGTYGGSIRTWDQEEIGQLRFLCLRKLKRKEGRGLSKGKKTIHMEMEKQMFGKQMYTEPSLTMGQREAVIKWTLLSSSLYLTPSSY